MSKFNKKKKRTTPGISTASLPDIVFMLLFFFMVTTVVRENTPKVQFTIPTTKYYEEIEDRSNIIYIYVGTQKDDKGEIYFEINGIATKEIQELVENIELKLSDYTDKEREQKTFALKIDKKDVDIGKINQLKYALQEVEVDMILYTSEPQS